MMRYFFASTLLLLSNLAFSQDTEISQPYTARPDTGFVGVYELAPDTFLMTFDCGNGTTFPTLLDSIFMEISYTDSFFPPKDEDTRHLYGSRKLTNRFNEHLHSYYYVYGTKGYMKCKIGVALYYSGPCECFYGLMIKGYDKTKCGKPLFTYPSELPISYKGDYKKIQALLNDEKKIMKEDTTGSYPYIDKIYPTVFANIGSRYFVYSDTFGFGECKFPERLIFDMSNDVKPVHLVWYSQPDFFGSPCD